MKALLSVFFLLCTLLVRVHAVEFSEEDIAGKRLTVCRVDLTKEKLQLFLRDNSGRPIKTFRALEGFLLKKGEKLTFAMNGGMYHGDFSPVGLYVSEGRQLSPLNLKPGGGNFFLKPNGVFIVTENGAQVIESSQYPTVREQVLLATQSGPMLVHKGKIHPKFSPNSESRLYRNGVCAPSPKTVVFVISEDPLNLYEFAIFFRDKLHCTEALFLDGTISSLYSGKLKRSDFRMDLGPIIGVTEPQ